MLTHPSDHHSTISAKMDGIKKSQDALAINYDANLDEIRKEILSLVGQNRTDESATQMAQLASLKTKLDALGKEHLACLKQNAVIRSLYFPVLRRRWSQIPHADRASNLWIFDASKIAFKTWLEDANNDDGLFCITGRVRIPTCTTLAWLHLY
jgi:hypothetical protein